MLRPLLVRFAVAAGVVVFASACTADATGPEPDAFDAAGLVGSTGPSQNDLELIITISGNGGGSQDDPSSPYFSLAGLPSTITAGQRLQRTISVEPYGPFGAPSAAVDYGEGAGPKTLQVVQTGGEVDIRTGERTPVSYHVTLNNVYETPGTYLIVVAMSEAGATRARSHTLVVEPAPRSDPVLGDVSIDAEAVVGEPLNVSGSFTDADGAGSYTLRYHWGTGGYASQFPTEPREFGTHHQYQEPGTYTVRVVISDGEGSDEVSAEVTIHPEPVVCAPGTYESGGVCVPAPAGSYVAVEGATEATLCAAGTFQDLEGQTGCKDAPAGSFVATPGAVQAEPCALGTYQPQAGQYTCIDTAPGSIAPETGLAEAVLCPVGTFQPQPGQITCILAEPGHFVAEVGATDDEPCTLGYFAAEPGQAACDPAPAGSYVDLPAATSAVPCGPGYYQDQEAQRYCVEAPAGSFVAYPGSATFELCPAGTFQPDAGRMVCLYAPAGSFATGPGATASELCQPGTYAAQEAQAACDPAPLGHFVPEAGATTFQICEPGSYAGSTGQIACDAAPAGTFVAHAGAFAPTVCEPGTFQARTGQTSCQAAPAGSFVAVSGAASATPCAVGSYQPGTGATSCLVAPVDTYVDVGGAVAYTPCPTGTGTLAAGSTSAADCRALGEIAVAGVDQALASGTLTAAAPGRKGEKELERWVSDLGRSVGFLAGPQHRAGCSGIRVAYREADGSPSPRDVVSGPARADLAALLLRILEEEGC